MPSRIFAMLHNGLRKGSCLAAAAASALLLAGIAGVDAKGVPPPALKIVSLDVEGGTALLFVTPEGKSLLIDTGWPPGIGGAPPMPGGAPPPPNARRAGENFAAGRSP